MMTVTLTLVAGEFFVRLTVAEETFWPISNIYSTSKIQGLYYTYKPDYNGIAFGVDLKTNSLGFRGPEWSKEKGSAVFRIALIGDSHAFGYGVPYESSVGEVLASILRNCYRTPVEVLNFGVNGYNSRQQRAVFQHLALGFNPDLVVLMPSSNDHKPALLVDREGWLHHDGGKSNPKSRIVDKSIEEVVINNPVRWISKSQLWRFLTLIRKRQQVQGEKRTAPEYKAEEIPGNHWMNPVSPGPVSTRLNETVYHPIEAILAHADSYDIPTIIAPFAGPIDYRVMFKTLERDHDIAIVELLTLFPEAHNWAEVTEKFGLGWDNHLNAIAHRRYAEGIAQTIETQPSLPTCARGSSPLELQ
jgi:lysophospholipase L1-like esterase